MSSSYINKQTKYVLDMALRRRGRPVSYRMNRRFEKVYVSQHNRQYSTPYNLRPLDSRGRKRKYKPDFSYDNLDKIRSIKRKRLNDNTTQTTQTTCLIPLIPYEQINAVNEALDKINMDQNNDIPVDDLINDSIDNNNDQHIPVEHDISDVSTGDINGQLWSNFNKLHPVPGLANIDDSPYVSATGIKNYLMSDPLLDWIKRYHKKNYGNGKSNGLNVLFEMGNNFEDRVEKHLFDEYGENVRKVAHNFHEINEQKSVVTEQYMMQGIPIITQAVLYNPENHTKGCADILIRSDWVNKLIKGKPYPEHLENLKAPNLNGDYHYVVIDIKWTTMELCANGLTLRNSGLFPAYKGQLAIYTAAVGLVQGYTPTTAYILAKAYKYKKCGVEYSGYNCFETMGCIDYEDWDNDYLDRSVEALVWYRDMLLNGSSWDPYKPHRIEMYPNMCNSKDSGFHNIKKDIATTNKELTSVYKVGVKNRNYAVANGITRYDDKKCTAASLNIKGPKTAPLVDQILKANRSEEKRIFPHTIGNNDDDWQTPTELEFFIDFESMNDDFYTKRIDLDNSKSVSDRIFMMGIGYVENGEWKYHHLTMNNVSDEEEERVIDEFFDIIEKKKQKFIEDYEITNFNLCDKPKCFFWSNAELNLLNSANRRHNNRWVDHVESIIWTDFCKIFQKEPITIKGVLTFKLKDVAKKMHEYEMISTKWEDSGPGDGFGAMMEASKYYAYIDQYNHLPEHMKASPINQQIYNSHKKIMHGIIKYNHVDCKVLWEMIDYFRVEHAYENVKYQNLYADSDDEDDYCIRAPEAMEVN